MKHLLLLPALGIVALCTSCSSTRGAVASLDVRDYKIPVVVGWENKHPAEPGGRYTTFERKFGKTTVSIDFAVDFTPVGKQPRQLADLKQKMSDSLSSTASKKTPRQNVSVKQVSFREHPALLTNYQYGTTGRATSDSKILYVADGKNTFLLSQFIRCPKGETIEPQARVEADKAWQTIYDSLQIP